MNIKISKIINRDISGRDFMQGFRVNREQAGSYSYLEQIYYADVHK